MMHSIRTQISASDKEIFRNFFESIGLVGIIIGDYEEDMNRMNRYTTRKRNICYAYSDKDTEAIAILTFIKLKYSSVDNAYRTYLKEYLSQNMHDTYFTWTP